MFDSGSFTTVKRRDLSSLGEVEGGGIRGPLLERDLSPVKRTRPNKSSSLG